MFRLLVNFAIAIGIVFSFASTSLAREDDYDLKAKNRCNSEHMRFNILILEDNPPFSWVTEIDNKGYVKPHGVGWLVLQEIIQSVGLGNVISPKMSSPNRKDLMHRTLHNPVDSAVGIQYTPGLEKALQEKFVSPAYFINPIVAVFVKGKEKEIKSTSDLSGLTGIVLAKDDMKALFPKDFYLTEAKSTREAFERLLDGEFDYLLMGYYAAELETKKFKISDEIVISSTPLRKINNFLTLNPSKPCFAYKKEFDKKMKEITSNKVKMQNLLYQAYQDYEAQNKNFPKLTGRKAKASNEPTTEDAF